MTRRAWRAQRAQRLDCSANMMAEREPGMVLPGTNSVWKNVRWGCGCHISRQFFGSKGMLAALCGWVCGLECEPCSYFHCLDLFKDVARTSLHVGLGVQDKSVAGSSGFKSWLRSAACETLGELQNLPQLPWAPVRVAGTLYTLC